jgi:hypothetical protein
VLRVRRRALALSKPKANRVRVHSACALGVSATVPEASIQSTRAGQLAASVKDDIEAARTGGRRTLTPMSKVAWSRTLIGVQPRIDVLRSLDQWHHSYLGHLLILDGT